MRFSPTIPFLRKLLRPHILRRILYERLTEPLHLNLASIAALLVGSFRTRVEFDLVLRQNNAWGILKAADMAKARGIKEIVAIEFGVAAGAGLVNMARIGLRVEEETGVRVRVVGFDTGRGMPGPVDYRDHPDLYAAGDFPMDVEGLKRILPPNAEVRLGDLSETVPAFLRELTPATPIGYAVLDVDYYSSSAVALTAFDGAPELYLPVTVLYVDDVMFDEHNSACGELLAIAEFNQRHARRRIEKPEFLPVQRLFRRAAWIPHIYYLHVLDHPVRHAPIAPPRPRNLDNPYL